MPYKRLLPNSKKYISPIYSPDPSYSLNSAGVPVHNVEDFFGIPLPNEKEGQFGFTSEKRKPLNPMSKIIKYLQKNIKIEELILVGLIILLLDESFDDDLLLIVLVYILLF